MSQNMKAPFAEPGQQGNRSGAGRSIILVGMMGVGKSTIGRRLAEALRLPFVDADEAIEKAADLSIAEIFERFGEPYFREGERRVIARLITGSPKVIATGGGAFMDPDTRRVILENGISIWLDADIDVLVKRTARRNTRPLLQSGDPHEILTNLARLRNPIYAEADIHLISNDAPHDEVVKRILEKLKTCTK